ncbi:hypothetical protein [Isosphaera pallida]|uniref:hypothetical protein n=1 Tax=Isosphaera pallida TaxID=128 RepID=UPI0003133C88|nr:hypothetical protein [Isosphaera pallida]
MGTPSQNVQLDWPRAVGWTKQHHRPTREQPRPPASRPPDPMSGVELDDQDGVTFW